MTFSHSKRLIKGAWQRRWFRRLTYLLAAGTVIGGSGLWTLRQPFFNRWLIEKLDGVVLAEAGLRLQAESVEFHLFQGRIVLNRFSVGEDMLRADRLDVQVDFASLLGRNPHIWKITLDNPTSVLDAKRLARIRLKQRPDRGSPTLVRLDRLAVTGGRLYIQEPAWGLPHAEFTYRISGRGLGPNRVATDIRVPTFRLLNGAKVVDGSFFLKSTVSDLSLELVEGQVDVAGNRLTAKGNYAFQERVLSGEVKGRVDLAEALRLADPKAPPSWSGVAEFNAHVRGSLSNPAWDLSLRGHGVSAPAYRLKPAEVQLAAEGSLKGAEIRELLWQSSQGKVSATGNWVRGQGSEIQFRCEQAGLAPLVSVARVTFLDSLFLDMSGTAEIPGDPWLPPRLDAIHADIDGRILRGGEAVGGVAAELAEGRLFLESVSLSIPEIDLESQGTIELSGKGLKAIDARGSVRTDASTAASVLHGWDIGEGRDSGGTVQLGMSGEVRAQAEVTWMPSTGFRLTGKADVEEPRWHGATLDWLHADVSIADDQLRLDNVTAGKGEGTASGNLWLTWQDVAPGQDEMDMCFQATGLPIEEGLRAGDAGDLPITGLGSGWARIHGPYDRLQIEATGVAQAGELYGVKIPWASGRMTYDIAGDRLIVDDVRIAERAEQLGTDDEAPSGLLALRGAMDMDMARETWAIWLKGALDSQPLGLPGPRFQAQVDANFHGPWTRPFGPVELPLGTASFSQGRVFLDQQSLEGLEGRVESEEDSLRLLLGSQGKTTPLASLEAWPKGNGLTGTGTLHLGPDSIDTAHLASRLSQDLLVDGALDLTAEGTWSPAGFAWQGRIDHLVAQFDGFDLIQEKPSHFSGNAAEVKLDLNLQGRAAGGSQVATAVPGGAAGLHVSGRVPLSARTPLGLRVEGEAELAYIKDIVDHVMKVDEYSLLADLKPEGKARFDVDLGGTFTDPSIEGLLSLQAGRLQIRTYPQSIEDLTFNLHFKGRDVYLTEADPLRGRIAQGNLTAWGMATWEIGGVSVYDLQTRIRNFQLRDLPIGFELYGDLDAVLQGTKEEGGVLAGALHARHMLYQADINLRDIVLASAMGGSSSLLGADPNDPLARIDLDLDLVLSQPWEFDTNLLKLQGQPVGAFKVLGTLAEPGLKGKMDIIPGGRLTNLLPAGDVVLERGTIEWTHAQAHYPNLDLLGRVDVPPYVVNLSLQGNLDNLEMKQSSTPSLRQDEITAILIDPSLAPNIGSLSATSSQNAMDAGLASTGSGLITTLALANFQESLRRTFKLDRVNVAWRTGSGTTDSETSVTVGKTVDIFGRRTPFVVTHQQSGDIATLSGQVEWRFGNIVLLLGVSQSGANGAAPSGEIRHTWSPGW